ncbi:MAG: hypothetical protein WAM53_18595, partial [Terrimicrobiaceae bacterium]
QQADHGRKHNRQETKNGVRIEAGLLLGTSDHLIHATGSQDLPELIGRIGTLLDVLQEVFNALRSTGGMLLLKRGLQKPADETGDLIGIRRRGAAAAEGGGQVHEIVLLGCAGRVVQGGKDGIKKAHSL